MSTKYFVFGALALVVLAACSSGDQVPATPNAGTAEASIPAAETELPHRPGGETSGRGSFYSPLPSDAIRFSFPFHIRGDRYYKVDDVMRRGLVFEFLRGDSSVVWDMLSQDLGGAGYRAIGSPRMDPNGRKIQAFALEGAPRLTVAISDALPDDPANPEAKGQIWINWEVESSQGAAEVP